METLRANGLDVWFDQDSLDPGDRWMTSLESAIEQSSAMIVHVGRLGVQTWVDREVRLGLERNTQNPKAFRLIPVLGEGADRCTLPPFLMQHQFVDLRDVARTQSEIERIVRRLSSDNEAPAIPSTIGRRIAHSAACRRSNRRTPGYSSDVIPKPQNCDAPRPHSRPNSNRQLWQWQVVARPRRPNSGAPPGPFPVRG